MHVVGGGVGRRKATAWYSVDSSFLVRIMLVLFALETLLINTSLVSGTKSFYIHWNTTNSIFRIDNTDHIIDVNKDYSKYEYDQVNIICPVYQPGTHEEDAEKYIIYNVSKEEYDTCRITNPNPRIIAVCDKPNKLMYFTITFRSFTPQPGGLEFQPGQDYYFISTSSKDDLHRRIGGRCSSDNMKVVFKVCCPKDKPVNNTSSLSSSSISPVSRSPVTTSSTTISTTVMYSPPQLPTRPTRPPPAKELPPTKPKKSNEYDKHPNEVLKNEELTYNTNGGSSSWRCSIPLVVALAWTQLALLLAPRRR